MKTENVKLGKDELVGFDRFVKAHYEECMRKAQTIVSRSGLPVAISAEEGQEWALHVFDKLASPLVFLKAAWRNELSSEDRMSFYPDAKEKNEKAKFLSDAANAMISQ